MQQKVSGAEKFFYKLNLIYRRFGPSRIFKFVFAKNRSKVKDSVRKLLSWDFDRVIMNHGEILSTNGKQAVERGFQELGF